MPEFEDLARAALREITPVSTVGDYVETVDEGDGVVSLLFASAQPGYPDWRWTVSVAHVEGEEPTVLEVELMPAEGALLAPDWVPWSERLADYKAAQEAAAESEDAESDEDDDDESDEDEDEDDDLGSDTLHGGDLDGVDIDSHDEESDDDDLDEDDEDDDDNFDEDDESERSY